LYFPLVPGWREWTSGRANGTDSPHDVIKGEFQEGA
jgi:hypothetical protein